MPTTIMAKVMVSAKSGGDWTQNELNAFNIRVDTVDSTVFFDTQQLPLSTVSPVILTNERAPQGPMEKKDCLFFSYMRQAEAGEESAVDDFAAFLLSLFNYDKPDRVIRQRKEISFVMCGHLIDTKPHVVVMNEETEYLLLVQEDKRGTVQADAEPQLIAEAIAAFHQNKLRRRLRGLPAVGSQTIPGIIMIGAVPVFYQIPVTQDLLEFVQLGQRPPCAIVAHRCIPPVPNPSRYPQEGLLPLTNRAVVMQCFQAFKAFVGLGL